jgi:hypothetical protein
MPARRFVIVHSRSFGGHDGGYVSAMAHLAQTRARALLDRYGQTYAEEAGIRLRDAPGPLYQLLVLATLLSARISSGVAVAAARELFRAGYRTPRAMAAASWQDRVDALGRGHYRRYDESTARELGKAAEHCLDRWHGDLRRMRAEVDGDTGRLSRLLQEFVGIGPTGADIFIREVQAVWTEFAPYLDHTVASIAAAHGLPSSPEALAETVPEGQFGRLTAALVRDR